mgnify:CR=1 FL=1
MGFIKAGFTGGFIGIVIGVGAIFTRYEFLNKLSSLGLLLAKSFGKVCTDTSIDTCTLAEKFTTIIAAIVGNCIAYFIVGALLSLGISTIRLWVKSEPKVEPIQASAESQEVKEAKAPVAAKRPAEKALISKKSKA